MAIRPQGSAFPWAIGGTNPWWCNHSILCSICSWRRAQPAGDVSNTSPGNGSSSAGWLVVVGKSTPLREGDRLPQRGAVLKDCARRRDKPVDQRSKEAETTSATRVYFSSAERLQSFSQNVPDQWLAATGLSTPLGFIASPLHRVVRSTGFGTEWDVSPNYARTEHPAGVGAIHFRGGTPCPPRNPRNRNSRPLRLREYDLTEEA
jgi:hypothetical protein